MYVFVSGGGGGDWLSEADELQRGHTKSVAQYGLAKPYALSGSQSFFI